MPKFKDLTTKKSRMDYIRRAVACDLGWATRALICIYNNQTADEQAVGDTKHHNKIGFTGPDAPLLTSFAEQWQARGSLSPKQQRLLFEKMPKYAKQLEAAAPPVTKVG